METRIGRTRLVLLQGDITEQDTDAYRSSLRLAAEHRLRSISFPSISTGAYRFPIERAASIALRTVREFLEGEPHALEEVRFVLFTPRDLAAYARALQRLSGDRSRTPSSEP